MRDMLVLRRIERRGSVPTQGSVMSLSSPVAETDTDLADEKWYQIQNTC